MGKVDRDVLPGLLAQGLTTAQIARRFGVQSPCITRNLAAMGLEAPGVKPRHNFIWSEVQALLDQGMGLRPVADRLGCGVDVLIRAKDKGLLRFHVSRRKTRDQALAASGGAYDKRSSFYALDARRVTLPRLPFDLPPDVPEPVVYDRARIPIRPDGPDFPGM